MLITSKNIVLKRIIKIIWFKKYKLKFGKMQWLWNWNTLKTKTVIIIRFIRISIKKTN